MRGYVAVHHGMALIDLILNRDAKCRTRPQSATHLVHVVPTAIPEYTLNEWPSAVHTGSGFLLGWCLAHRLLPECIFPYHPPSCIMCCETHLYSPTMTPIIMSANHGKNEPHLTGSAPRSCLASVPDTGAAFSVACLGVYRWGFNLGRSLDHLHDINHAFVCLVPTLTPLILEGMTIVRKKTMLLC